MQPGQLKTNLNSVATVDKSGVPICIVFKTASPFDTLLSDRRSGGLGQKSDTTHGHFLRGI